MKRIFKMLFCKHEYWWRGEVTWSNSIHERKDICCECKKCGKEKSFVFKKAIDKSTEL